MKKAVLFFLLTASSVANSFAQNDSLRLKLIYEVFNRDSAFPENIRVDFISKKSAPITFYEKPLYLLECELDDIGLVSEQLNGDCYTGVVKSDCHPWYGFTQKNESLRQLRYGDTSFYRNHIFFLDKDKVNKRLKGFTGNYRFRVYRFYTENNQRKKIFSNWLYVNYP